MENTTEIWKDIKGYEGLYEVSNYGRVKSLERNVISRNQKGEFILHVKERIMKQTTGKDGYKVVTLTNTKGKQKSMRVNILIATAFISNPNNYEIVHHKNRNKEDNNVNNLEWLSKEGHYKEHAAELAEALKKIERPKGGKHPFYGKKRIDHAKKLSIPIIEVKNDGTIIEWESTKKCAEKYGFTTSHLTNAVNGKNHKRGHYFKTSLFYKKSDYEKMLEDIATS